jgi:hypothetical protein
MNDKSKRDPDIAHHLQLVAFSHRVRNRLCIYCGQVYAPLGACDACKIVKSAERIAKYGRDYMEDED